MPRRKPIGEGRSSFRSYPYIIAASVTYMPTLHAHGHLVSRRRSQLARAWSPHQSPTQASRTRRALHRSPTQSSCTRIPAHDSPTQSSCPSDFQIPKQPLDLGIRLVYRPFWRVCHAIFDRRCHAVRTRAWSSRAHGRRDPRRVCYSERRRPHGFRRKRRRRRSDRHQLQLVGKRWRRERIQFVEQLE